MRITYHMHCKTGADFFNINISVFLFRFDIFKFFDFSQTSRLRTLQGLIQKQKLEATHYEKNNNKS